jgi:hypothetical protein
MTKSVMQMYSTGTAEASDCKAFHSCLAAKRGKGRRRKRGRHGGPGSGLRRGCDLHRRLQRRRQRAGEFRLPALLDLVRLPLSYTPESCQALDIFTT